MRGKRSIVCGKRWRDYDIRRAETAMAGRGGGFGYPDVRRAYRNPSPRLRLYGRMTRTTVTMPVLALACLAILAPMAPAQEPCQAVRIEPPSIVPATNFGRSVAVAGDFWFISDSSARVLCAGDPFNCAAGAVHVYEMVDGVLEFRQMLVSPQPRLGDLFGHALDVQDGRLIVGSIYTEWPGLEADGAGHIFEHDGERWVQTATLSPPEGVSRLFAAQLGGVAAIEDASAYLRPVNREFVFSYVNRDGQWRFHEMIECPDALPRQAGFGLFIEAQGEWVFITAHQDSSLVHFGGSVYAYRREPHGTLAFVQKIVPTDAPGGPGMAVGFGSGVSFDGQTLAIGVYGADRSAIASGAVMLYKLVDGRWTFQQEITHPDAAYIDKLGERVRVEGDVLLAVAGGQDSAVASSALHLFRRGVDGRWTHDGQLGPNPPEYSYLYAFGLATDGRYAIAGASDDLDPAGRPVGAAYLFDLTCGECAVDLDADGSLTVFDFLTYLNLFQDGDPQADFDGDGELTIFDFLAFQTAFDAGC
jgi:hypothetical protein